MNGIIRIGPGDDHSPHDLDVRRLVGEVSNKDVRDSAQGFPRGTDFLGIEPGMIILCQYVLQQQTSFILYRPAST